MIKETKSKGSIRSIAISGIFILLFSFDCYMDFSEKKEINIVVQVLTLILFTVLGIYEAKKIIRMQSDKIPISRIVWYILVAILLIGSISPYVYVGLLLVTFFIMELIGCVISESKNNIRVYCPLRLTDTTDREFVKQ